MCARKPLRRSHDPFPSTWTEIFFPLKAYIKVNNISLDGISDLLLMFFWVETEHPNRYL